ncbi:MAG: hypothetical protein P8R42_22475 [Candidatus Binatia bacterium]|nr:hypothetical protein [Candidatus Binatia bacterium]
MSTTTKWRVITPALLAELPDRPGVFEIGNLVRTVLFIGFAPCGIAADLREALTTPRLLSRAHCIRFEVSDEGEDRARERLAEYRRVHAGILPYAHRHDPLTSLLDARRPPARALPLARPGRKSGPATFRRSSPGA